MNPTNPAIEPPTAAGRISRHRGGSGLEATVAAPDVHRPSRLAAGLLRDLGLLEHGPVTELAGHLEGADPLLHRMDYLSALSTAPRTDLRFALRAS